MPSCEWSDSIHPRFSGKPHCRDGKEKTSLAWLFSELSHSRRQDAPLLGRARPPLLAGSSSEGNATRCRVAGTKHQDLRAHDQPAPGPISFRARSEARNPIPLTSSGVGPCRPNFSGMPTHVTDEQSVHRAPQAAEHIFYYRSESDRSMTTYTRASTLVSRPRAAARG